MLPSIFGENLFDGFFDAGFDRAFWGGRDALYGKHAKHLMKTDVKETENEYKLSVDLPGVKKDDLKAQLKDGYLTISATVNQNNDEKDEEGRYIRRERFSGSFNRSFYVGEDVTQEDIKARFEDGTLMLMIPKKETTPQVEEKKYIAIEG